MDQNILTMRYIYFLVLFFQSLNASAQINISAQLPPSGPVDKDQLWNLILVNNANVQEEVRLFLSVDDPGSGITIFTAETGPVSLSRGIKNLSVRNVQPVQYNFASSWNGRFLPVGRYIACYSIFPTGEKATEPLARECIQLNVLPMSPPLLSYPANGAEVPEPYPSFIWMPPVPLEMFHDLTYDLVLAEVNEGQSPSESVLYNTPVYTRSGLRINQQQYPSSLRKLDSTKIYAWQVSARDLSGFLVQTEVWSFKMRKDSSNGEVKRFSSILLNGTKDKKGIVYVSGDVISVKHYSYSGVKVAVFLLKDARGKQVDVFRASLKYGENLLNIPLGKRFQKGEVYSIEYKDPQQQFHSLSFSIQ